MPRLTAIHLSLIFGFFKCLPLRVCLAYICDTFYFNHWVAWQRCFHPQAREQLFKHHFLLVAFVRLAKEKQDRMFELKDWRLDVRIEGLHV